MTQPQPEQRPAPHSEAEEKIVAYVREHPLLSHIFSLGVGREQHSRPASRSSSSGLSTGSAATWPSPAERALLRSCGARILEARANEQALFTTYESARRALVEKGAVRRCMGALLPRSAVGREMKISWGEFQQAQQHWRTERGSLLRLEEQAQREVAAIARRALPILGDIAAFRDSVTEGAEILRNEQRALAHYNTLQTQANAMCPGSDSLMHPADSDVARGWNRYIKEQRVVYADYWHPRVQAAGREAQSATQRRVSWYGPACQKVDSFSCKLREVMQELQRRCPPYWERAHELCRATLAIASRSDLWTDGFVNAGRIRDAERNLTDFLFQQNVGCSPAGPERSDRGAPRLRVGRFLSLVAALAVGGGIYATREKIPGWWAVLLRQSTPPAAATAPVIEPVLPSTSSSPVQLSPAEQERRIEELGERFGFKKFPRGVALPFQGGPPIRRIGDPRPPPPDALSKRVAEFLEQSRKTRLRQK